MMRKIFKKVLLIPTIFFSNPTRKQLYTANINRFFYSFHEREEKYSQFKQILAGLPYSKQKKRKFLIHYALLFHLIGMEPEEYMLTGGGIYSSLHNVRKNSITSWRQNIFQFSVNKSHEKSEIQKTLDDKESFNKLFADLLAREYITTDKSEN